MLLLDEDKRINGVLTIEAENDITWKRYLEINEYANFITQTSSKYIQENTNKLLSDFSHTTKNILKDINKIIKDLLRTKDKDLLNLLKTRYLKDEELIKHLINTEGRKRQDFLAYNRISDAFNIVNNHIEYFKRRHKYYTNSVNSNFEEIKLSDFLKRVGDKRNNILIKNLSGEEDPIIEIKAVPIELAFKDLIDNALRYSEDNKLIIQTKTRGLFVEIKLTNKVNPSMSINNYDRLGKEDIKNDNGTFSTGISNSFQCINEDNDISLASHDYYLNNKLFEVIIKLKKK